MLEWALLMVAGDQAEVLAMKGSEIECWQAASEAEVKDGNQLACFELVTVLEKQKQGTTEEQ